MYQSKYYTCEEIDERLLKGYYDDAVLKGYTGTIEQMQAALASENYLDLTILYPDQSFTFNTAVEKITSLVTPLNKGFRFSYVDTDYADGVYLTFEYRGEIDSEQAWVCVGDLVVSTSFVDSVPKDALTAVKIISGKLPSRWIVKQGNYVIGIIDILGDSMYHQLTEILTTHCNNGLTMDWNVHDDTRTYKYFRSYNIRSPHLPVDPYTWTDWAIVDRPLNELGDSYKDSVSQGFFTEKIEELTSQHICLSESEYEALPEKDVNKIYMVYEDDEEEEV